MPDNPDKLVTIITFSYPQELYIIRARLESEGIKCFVVNELTLQTQPLYSNAVGGVKLQVYSKYAGRATKILKQEGYITEPDNNKPNVLFANNKLLRYYASGFSNRLYSW